MPDIPQGLYYSEEHEYVRDAETEGEYLVGITDFAQSELGDVVYVELPTVGETFEQMEVFGTIEAVKAVSELYCPLSGEVMEINGSLEEDPALVNTDPYGEGWMIRIRAEDETELDELLSATSYETLIEA